MGEIGKPLARILARRYECIGVDLAPVDIDRPCSVLHICYPFQIGDFVSTTVRYIRKYKPAITIINSTVPPGTTRRIQIIVNDSPVTYSPVRGKHALMEDDMLRYKKFVAACTQESLLEALEHFKQAGIQTGIFRTPEIAELSKLIETTAFGVLIAWAQEVERFAAFYGADFDEVNAFIEEIDFLPSHIFPGQIGGHCVMPNIALLQTQFQSSFLTAIVDSNQAKQAEQQSAAFGAGVKQ
jgi:UDP-N-acetyl-D-mannosaminuronate dehydrogenase